MVGFKGHEQLFIGQHALALERHYRVLSNIDFHYGRCWPLDLAVWDLAGKITGQPSWRLLVGLSNRVRAYASSGTLRALEAVRARVGERLELLVDCNQGWRMAWDTQTPWTLKDALAVARELERLDVYWMEEPLHRADRAGMRTLRDSVDVRIAGGEMTRAAHELRDLIVERCLDVVQPDAALVGGITGLRRVALLAQEYNLTFTPHTWTNGMGVVANTHLLAGLSDAPFIEFPSDPPQSSLERRDFMLAQPFAAEGGWLTLGETPGMGYEIDGERLNHTLLGREL